MEIFKKKTILMQKTCVWLSVEAGLSSNNSLFAHLVLCPRNEEQQLANEDSEKERLGHFLRRIPLRGKTSHSTFPQERGEEFTVTVKYWACSR